jgi:serine/threonine protein kinase
MKDIPEISGYRIEKVLGQGAMATVYLGVQENLGREVAIKILTPEMFRDEQYRTRFLNEAHTASRLSHPNIVTIHDVGQVGNHCYIVMERLYESLVQRVKSKPDSRLHPIEAFKIIRKIAGALYYAHEEGFIHRDIKPDNILFRKDGTPVLVDFGIARALDSPAQLTTTGMIIGTPHYMSPEQCRGEQIDGQSDIYSLGIVLYEILTGDVPYRADSAAGVLLKHVQYALPQLPPELSKYQPLLTRMIAKEKQERVSSGIELIRLLDNYAPDTRIETIQGVKEESWVFGDSSRTKVRPGGHPVEDSEILTRHTPMQTPVPVPRHKSKGPLIVILLSVPLILAAAFFLFFPDHFSRVFTGKEIQNEQKQTNQQEKEENKEVSPKQASVENKTRAIQDNYKQNVMLAEEYLTKGDYEKALESLEKARTIKNTAEVKALGERINQQVSLSEEKEFLRYFTLAKNAYKKGNYQAAKKNIQKTKKYKTTEALEKLARDIADIEKKIAKKKAEEAEKARIAAARKRRLLQKDDQAYKRAVSRNTIYAYEKYLQNYPKGRHAEQAEKKYEELKKVFLLEERIKDDTAYESAVSTNTISAYEDYLEKYPSGGHVEKARTRILQLKDKIVKETKIKLSLRHIKFFESDFKAPPVARRKYTTRFSKENTRYIFTEIAYNNKFYRIANSKSRVTLVYSNADQTVREESKGAINQQKGAETGLYWRGMGWSEPGKWLPGNYTVTIFLEGQKVGQSRFEIY